MRDSETVEDLHAARRERRRRRARYGMRVTGTSARTLARLIDRRASAPPRKPGRGPRPIRKRRSRRARKR